jgi:hypothetical protein
MPAGRPAEHEGGIMLRSRVAIVAVIGWGALVSSCAAVNVNREWQDPTSKAETYRSMMVYGSCQDSVAARILEDDIVRDLRTKGMDARAAYDVVDAQTHDLTEPKLRGMLEALGIDGIIVARMTGVENHATYIPASRYAVPDTYYNGFYDRFVTVYHHVYEPGYLDRYQVLDMQADLYDARSGRLMSSLSTSQMKGDDVNENMREFSKTLVSRWAHMRVLA